jgi:hypothetical protein
MSTYTKGDRITVTNPHSQWKGKSGVVAGADDYEKWIYVDIEGLFGEGLMFHFDEVEHYGDFTERAEPVTVAWIDPAEQTGSDDETAPIEYVPVKDRYHRPRIHKEHGYWWVKASIYDTRFAFDDGTPTHIAEPQDTFEEALDIVRLELAKEAA